MKEIYLVQVYGEYADDGFENLGVFSTKEKAEQVANDYNKGCYGDYQAHVLELNLDELIED